MSSASTGTKRKYHGGNNGRRYRNNPSRGGPAVFLTCETGREIKCEREGLQILRFYHELQQQELQGRDAGKGDNGDSAEKEKLSLDDELRRLREHKTDNQPFRVFETGCRGVIVVMCAMEDCSLVPSGGGDGGGKIDDEQAETNDSGGEESKPRTDEAAKKQRTSTESTPWDPVATVRRILSDLRSDASRHVPSSRFLTRMIPVQATCFATPDDIQSTTRKLLQRFFPDDAKTYAVTSKRRNCSTIKSRQEIIDAVGKELLAISPDCKVHLDDPDVTVNVEICKTLCGISVLPNMSAFGNFNLADAREHRDDGASESK